MPKTRAQAACEACGKTFRVADATRTYRCKACGGVVRASDALPAKGATGPVAPGPGAPGSGAPAFDELAACATCDALNPPASAYCAECGAALAPTSSGARPGGGHGGGHGSSGRARGAGEGRGARSGYTRTAAAAQARGGRVSDEQRRAAAALVKSFRAVRVLGVLFWIFAVLTGLATIRTILALRELEIPLEPGLLAVAISALLTIFLVVGALMIRFQPFFWTVAIASLATINLAFLAWRGGVPWILLGVRAAITLAFWIAVVPTVRHRQLVRRWPDLYIAQRIHGTHLSRKLERGAGDPAGARRVLERAAARGWRTAGLAATVLLAIFALGAWQAAATRPPTLASALERVRAAWRAGDAPGVVALAPEPERAERAALLAAVAAGHGWGARWPALAEPEAEHHGAMVVARFELDSAAAANLSAPAIGLRLVRRDAGWVLEELLVPLPPVELELARFADAWARGDVDALGRLFGPERRERMQGQLERSVSRRGWETGWPALEGGELRQTGERRSEATYRAEGGGRVTAHWRFEPDGSWVLSGLELPDR